MSRVDDLLDRIDAALALPPLPPLEPEPPRFTPEQLRAAALARQELIARDRPRPWWKRVIFRGL
jgi:hypothetical protein